MKEKCCFKWFNRFLMVFFAALLIVAACKLQPGRTGDGAEYMMQVEAWLNHGSMDIRQEDYITAVSAYGEEMTKSLYDWNTYPYHHFSTDDGREFAPHFGGYAFFCLPVKLLLRALGMNQFRCFLITNALLYFAALLSVFFGTRISEIKKSILLLLLMINPAVFYIHWTHTEIFSFSFVIVGLVLFYNKKHKLSILCISIAAMQNVALVFLGMVVGLDYWRKIIVASKQSNGNGTIGKTIKILFGNYFWDIVLAGICYIPCLLPILHTLVNFGEINLVASVARENRYLIEKAMAYWFDLNLGIFPYMPVFTIIFFVTWIVSVRKKTWDAFMMLIALGGIYYVLSNQRQINCGMAGIMRYNVWVIPILIFFVVYHMDLFYRKKIVFCSMIPCVLTSLMAIAIATGAFQGNPYGDIEFAPWTKLTLKYIPAAYSPYHGIFITRTLHREQYSTDLPVVYCDNNGYVRKILLPDIDTIQNVEVMGNNNAMVYYNDCVSKLKKKEYQYITIPHHIKLERVKRSINKFEASNIDLSYGEYDFSGVYPKEENYCWLEPEAQIVLLSEEIRDGLEISYRVLPELLAYAKIKQVETDIHINGKLIKKIDANTNALGDFQSIIIPYEELPDAVNKRYVVDFKTNSYFCPSEEGLSNDNRKLSIQLQYMGEER